MIKRYQRQVMKQLWSDQNKFDTFLKVELACSYAWSQLGLIPDQEYQLLKKATFTLEDIESIEQETKHDVIAFTKAVSKSLGDEKKWLHYGLTSTDVVDTAQSLILKDVNNILINDIEHLLEILKQKAYDYQNIPCIGRTHGIHAEVTSFGLKFALWYADLIRIKALFVEAAKNVQLAKLSGAVGNYSANTPDMEKIASKQLGLMSAPIATQTLQRDRHAHYLSVIALIGSELEKIAVEIRHLSRTEVGEVSEYFDLNQKGSSAMPHKKNPIGCENISGLSRVLRGYMLTSYDDIALWHERDISHSSVERIILPDATTLLDYMLNRMSDIIDHLIVNQKKMAENINMTKGAVFTQSILNLLIEKGVTREIAYDRIQKAAFEVMNGSSNLEEALKKDTLILKYLSEKELHSAFEISKHLRFVNDIFAKVFE